MLTFGVRLEQQSAFSEPARFAGADGVSRTVLVWVDPDAGTVTVGSLDDLMVAETPVEAMTWVHGPAAYNARVFVQTSAHGTADLAVWRDGVVVWDEPHRRVAPGQSVVLYAGDNDSVVGGGLAQ